MHPHVAQSFFKFGEFARTPPKMYAYDSSQANRREGVSEAGWTDED
jgi:hypothetical protein